MPTRPEEWPEYRMELRPEVDKFSQAMEEKLRENDYRGGWQHCDIDYLFMRMAEERQELRRAVRGKDPVKVLREAADIANFALMIADNFTREGQYESSRNNI